eukprot:CAMPEP_0198215058 /NCGR_PEP_ID=MMETSP1445-20131203/46608_1 /TAXON_ID=36898 /ORGANISM="Pyramimonas sp., Strain CCMP2087" /LENGTH=373 /DNA_ID=CAMNT_0043890579 /DNA_START=87 /DNA_END=1205 /DNA_ORIENTATION=-
MIALRTSLCNAAPIERSSRTSASTHAGGVQRARTFPQRKPVVSLLKARCLTTAASPQQRFSCTGMFRSLQQGHQGLHKHRRQPQRQSLVCTATVVSAPILAAACLLPTCLGYFQSEYTVSYGYGTATALAAALIHEATKSVGGWEWTLAHSLVLVLYGLRLNLYLFYRESFIPRFSKFGKKIEERAKAKGSRLARTPFIVSCALLYLGLAAPLVLSAAAPIATIASESLCGAFKVCIGAAYLGWAVAAVGDFQKAVAKANGVGLVTTGLYSVLRHPNYTGEMLLWTSSFVAGCVSFAAMPTRTVAHFGWLALSFLGILGINFVLMQATRGLEKRQRAQYSGSKYVGAKYANNDKYNGGKYNGSKYGGDEYQEW